MSLVCKIAGHKWNRLPDGSDGCVCQRCGQRRNAGHDWRLTHKNRECLEKCEVCGRTRKVDHSWNGCICPNCGLRRDQDHDWQGCTCARCGKIRGEGHEWGAWKSLDKAEHKRTCTICRRTEREDHAFRQLPNCRARCTKCGFETVRHDFVKGKCTVCGADENDYYAGLILSNRAKFNDRIPGAAGSSVVTYGDRVSKVDSLVKIALSGRKEIRDNALSGCVFRLSSIARAGGSDARAANLGLRDILLSDKVDNMWDKQSVAKAICDPEIAAQPATAKAIREILKACDDYDRAMIAMDSGM